MCIWPKQDDKWWGIHEGHYALSQSKVDKALNPLRRRREVEPWDDAEVDLGGEDDRDYGR